jgi:hypothetical protein
MSMNIVDFGVLMVDENLNTVKPEQWRELSDAQKSTFRNSWARRGIVSFCCLNCGYPTVHGQGMCVSCSP